LLNWDERRWPNVCECSDFKVFGIAYTATDYSVFGYEVILSIMIMRAFHEYVTGLCYI
jgi:hypothetical protein